MKKPGIHNPFKKPKPNIPSIYDEEPFDTESNLREPPTVTLDGDSYAIRFIDATIDGIRDRLYNLLYEVKNSYPDALQRNGILVGTEIPSAPDVLLLKTEKGQIGVYSEEDNEISAFRRIGHVLFYLPIHETLLKHNVRIIKRR